MFSKSTYLRLLELYNDTIWPFQLVAVLLTICLFIMLLKNKPVFSPAIALILAFFWAWTGWQFHWRQFSSINIAARYFAGLFIGQSALLLSLGVFGNRLKWPSHEPMARWGLGLFVFAGALMPMFKLFLGHSYHQVVAMGWGPDTTALGTLGILLMARGRFLWRFLCLPAFLWMFITIPTGWALNLPGFELWSIATAGAILGWSLRKWSAS